MAKYRSNLPQLSGKYFLTDGGLETTLVFHHGLELPHFASFDLLSNEQGKRTLRNYFLDYISIAKQYKVGFILESATWRANSDWAYKLGYSEEELVQLNELSISELEDLRNEHEEEDTPLVISGNIGPRGDGL